MRSGATRPASRWPTTGAASATTATPTSAIVARRRCPGDPVVRRCLRRATSHAPPAPTATADRTARPAKLRALSPRLAAYSAAGARPIAATSRTRAPVSWQGAPGDQAPTRDRQREQERRRAIDPEGDVDVARLDDRQRVEREDLAGRQPDHQPPPTRGQDSGPDEDRRQPSQAGRRDGSDERDRQDQQGERRLLDQDREPEEDAAEGPASSGRSPDGQQGGDDRGRLREVDAE